MDYNSEGDFLNIVIYDCNIEDDIYVGLYYDMPYKLDFKQVVGWELQLRNEEPYICFNVE